MGLRRPRSGRLVYIWALEYSGRKNRKITVFDGYGSEKSKDGWMRVCPNGDHDAIEWDPEGKDERGER